MLSVRFHTCHWYHDDQVGEETVAYLGHAFSRNKSVCCSSRLSSSDSLSWFYSVKVIWSTPEHGHVCDFVCHAIRPVYITMSGLQICVLLLPPLVLEAFFLEMFWLYAWRLLAFFRGAVHNVHVCTIQLLGFHNLHLFDYVRLWYIYIYALKNLKTPGKTQNESQCYWALKWRSARHSIIVYIRVHCRLTIRQAKLHLTCTIFCYTLLRNYGSAVDCVVYIDSFVVDLEV